MKRDVNSIGLPQDKKKKKKKKKKEEEKKKKKKKKHVAEPCHAPR